MAKLTLIFKEKPVQVYHFDSESVAHIGRDESNTIRIDSLAVAPVHAVILFREEGHTIKKLNEGFPLLINNQDTSDRLLENGDRITIGKHTLHYTDNEIILQKKYNYVEESAGIQSLNEEIEQSLKLTEANLQVLNGKHIGRVIPLKCAMTRLGKTGSSVAVISKRKDGYFLAPLEGITSIKLNNNGVGDTSIQLKSGDTLDLDDTTMQFYIDKGHT